MYMYLQKVISKKIYKKFGILKAPDEENRIHNTGENYEFGSNMLFVETYGTQNKKSVNNN
jgi:hypothetical protein